MARYSVTVAGREFEAVGPLTLSMIAQADLVVEIGRGRIVKSRSGHQEPGLIAEATGTVTP
jgi:hypothetical protein